MEQITIKYENGYVSVMEKPSNFGLVAGRVAVFTEKVTFVSRFLKKVIRAGTYKTMEVSEPNLQIDNWTPGIPLRHISNLAELLRSLGFSESDITYWQAQRDFFATEKEICLDFTTGKTQEEAERPLVEIKQKIADLQKELKTDWGLSNAVYTFALPERTIVGDYPGNVY